jgi:parallel beta-helix repeat protein
MIKRFLVIGIVLLFILMSINPSTAFDNIKKSSTPVSSGNTLYVGGSGEGNYTKIQYAIDNTSDGDTVFVYDDISPYYENVFVDKSIQLIGENRDTTIIDAGGIGDVVYVSADWVNITGFTIQNSESHGIGIKTDSDFNCFSYNNVLNNLHGFYLSGSIGNMIIGNNASYNNNGIFLWGCNNNTIISNNATSNRKYGITMHESHNNMIIGNNASNTDDVGIYLSAYSTNNMIIDNNASYNKNGFYLEGESDYNMIIGNNASYNDLIGIYLAPYSNDIMIIGNSVSNNDNGIFLWWETYNNLLYHNNLINNSVNNAWDSSENNIWFNSTLQEGNYYDDYIGVDEDGDGIGDIPYYIPGVDSEDSFPLMVPWDENVPSKPFIDGTASGHKNIEYSYTFKSTSPIDRDVYYYIEWGDNTITNWTGPYTSGQNVTINHTWKTKGTFTIKARAKDTEYLRGPWSTFEVKIKNPRNRVTYDSLFMRFLERFPILERLLFSFR